MPIALTSKRYLRKAQVQQRYGDVSPTWIKRRVVTDGFPPPAMYVGASPLWDLESLDAWDTVQAAKSKPEPVRDMATVRAAREVRS